MELAGVVIGSIALILAVFSSAYAAFQLHHVIRFRKPVFTVDKVELLVKEQAGHKFVEAGEFVLNVRGATHPVTLTWCEVVLFTRGRTGGGLGTQCRLNIPPLEWTRIQVPSIGIGLGEEHLPPHLEAEVYLSNPHDVYVVPVTLELSKDGSKYYGGELGYTRRYLYRTVWRHRGRLRRFLRAVSRGRLG